MKKYVKLPIPISAKLFEKGDEDGINDEGVPYVSTIEGRALQAEYGKHYLVQGNHNDKWLVEKTIFENTYKEFQKEKHFYRIGHSSQGLWYTKDGTFTGDIHTEKYNWLNASGLKMPFDELLVGFISVADSLEHLYQWFSTDEIKRLQKEGFFIEEWISSDYKFYNPYQHNVINQQTSVLNKKLIIYENS